MRRLGRETRITPDEYVALNIYEAVEALEIRDGETMADVAARLDPDRIAHVLGVTEHGAYEGATVTTYGEKLWQSGDRSLGVDMLVVPPGSGFPVHVHAGHHLLFCVKGPGTFSLAGDVHEVRPGDLSMIEGSVPHAVGNPYSQPHILLAIGAPPRELDAEDRMTVTDWKGEPLLVMTGHDRPDGPVTKSGHFHDHSHDWTHSHD